MNAPGDNSMQTSQVSRGWFGIVVATLAVGALIGSPPLVGIGLLLGAMLGLAWLWARYSLSALTFERTIDPPRANWGEEVEIRARVTNRKALPLAWLEVADEAPKLEFTRGNLNPVYRPGRAALEWRVALGWYERITRHFTLVANRRGEFYFGPVTLRAGDLFGLFSRSITFPVESYMLIYPRVVPVEELGIPAREPFGEAKAVQPLVVDPLRPQGVRAYSSGDSRRFIHWRASARTGTLQTRVFEPAATPQLWLFCNQQTFEREWEGINSDALELAIVVTASLATHAVEQGYAVALEGNAPSGESDQHVRIGASTSPDQLAHILEALARLHGWSGVPIEAVIERARRNLAWGASVVVVTSTVSDLLLQLLLGLRRSGHPVTLVQVSTEEDAAGGDMAALGITYYRVSAIGREAYREVASLALA